MNECEPGRGVCHPFCSHDEYHSPDSKDNEEPSMSIAKSVLHGCFFVMGPVAAALMAQENPATMVEHEFAIPASKGDSADGRLTVMAAGGGIDANIDRWYGQFTQPDGASTR